MHPIQRILGNDFECCAYSGRAMYGKKCLGVVVPGNNLGWMIAVLVDNVDDEDREQVCEALDRMKTDSLGHDTIVYFSTVGYVEAETDLDAWHDEHCPDCGEKYSELIHGQCR